MEERLIASLGAAVEASPQDVPLRLHLAEMLLAAGDHARALQHVALALVDEPDSSEARELMTRTLSTSATSAAQADDDGTDRPPAISTTDTTAPAPPRTGSQPEIETGDFDWAAAQAEVDDVVGPMFVDGSTPDGDPGPWVDSTTSTLSLADVGGLAEVKKRLNASFLAPLRNPELRAAYGTSLRGGLLLYGPPGCGKTFLARAVAGELGASFLHVSLADILDMYVGVSEQNVQELFQAARAAAPCVLFLDELDAIGQKRSLTRHSGTRGTVNQLLTELDGVGSDNEGVYLLAATNHPWDVDPALRRPGRLDRTLLVLPPDREAREQILRTHLRERPVERIDLRKLAKQTEGLSGADLAHLCESASQRALMDSVETGTVRLITMADLTAVLGEIRPSITPWLDTARNVALYANASGEYDDLATWLRKNHRNRR